MIHFEQHRIAIEKICLKLNVRRLGYFGSVNTPKFRDESDIDFLVIFEGEHELDLFTRYFQLKECLEKLFSHQVDLVFDKHFKNPYFQETVQKSRKTIYEKRSQEIPA